LRKATAEDISPVHFTAEDRRRHHHDALFFVENEDSTKVKLTRSASGHTLPPDQQVEVPAKPLTLWGMVAIIFFAVSGGPFGSEEAVANVGPFWVLAGFIVLPIIWSIPEALMTAELSTTFPGNGGYVFWTTAAFGSRLGFLQGFWSWLSNVTNIAVYPHLLLEYLSAEFPVMKHALYSTIFLTMFTVSMSYINYRGLHIIGSGGAVAIILVLCPFLVLAIVGFPMIDWEILMEGKPTREISALAFVSFLNVMFWNLNSWENCSVLSGEISNPQKSLPRAIWIALIITVLSYLVPLTVGIGAMSGFSTYSEWTAGYFQIVGYHVGGRPMALLILFGATFGCIGQYQSILCSSAYSLQALGEIGMLPAWVAKRSPYDTPTVGIAIATTIVLSLTTFGFVDIVQLLNSVYCLSLLVEFSTLVYLRKKCSHMKRPFKIGLSMFGLTVMITPAIITVMAMLIVPPLYGNFMTTYYMIGGTVVAVIAYESVELGRRRKWFEFCDDPPRNHVEVVQRLRVF
jgi:amino acid transporter